MALPLVDTFTANGAGASFEIETRAGAIADSACGYAACPLMPEDSSVLTVEYKMNLLAPADGDEMIARVRVLRSGRTMKICAADV